jgi:TetR/AcrR family transcriptional regulator, transcriptional repressor for nem operon
MDTRQRLIESTMELLWERGYVATSPKAIQLRAQAGQGSMYHHFSGKHGLALEAIRRSAEQVRTVAESYFTAEGSAYERISAYLTRERDVLRGCRIGRLTQDPDIMADPELRRPLDETFGWMRKRLAETIACGQAQNEFDSDFDPGEIAAAIISTLQGGFVLSKAAGSEGPFNDAIRGMLRLLGSLKT